MRRFRYVSDKAGIFNGRIPLVSLIQFLAVSEHLNFRHAANTLGVTQSSVSSRIKALEEVLGVNLFERRHRGVRLTPAGRRFVDEVSKGVEQLDHAVQSVRAVSSGTEGDIAIGLICSLAGGFLAELRSRFGQQFPSIGQTVFEGSTAQSIRLIRDGSLDVAFVLDPVHAPDCHKRSLWAEPYYVALPSEHLLTVKDALAWTDLSGENCLLRVSGAGPQLFQQAARRFSANGECLCTHRVDVGRDTLMSMVAAGDGITVISESATYIPFPGIVFRPIAAETEPARFSAVWLPHNRNPALVNLLDIAVQMSRSVAAKQIRTS